MKLNATTSGFVLAVLLGSTGCGSRLQKAGGTVSVDGVLVTCGGTIMFCPTGGGRPATGTIMTDGSFTLSYQREGDGLPLGEYKVVIVADIWKEAKTKTKAQLADAAMAKKSGAIDDAGVSANAGGILIHVVPTIYNDVSTTPHRETVTASSDTQQFKIDIKTKAKK